MKANRKQAMRLIFTGILALWFSAAGAEEGVAESRGVPPLVFSVRDNTLSAKIEDFRLGEVLNELARQTRLNVYIAASIAEEQISAKFDNLPLEEGIKRLLQGKNHTLIYDHNAAPPRLAEIRVISTGSDPIRRMSEDTASFPLGAEPPPVSLEKNSVEKLAQQALQAPDPSARISALKALGERGEEEEIRSTVASAMQDQDPGVRGTALESVQRGMPVSLEAVHGMALHDASPELRVRAWDELVDQSDPDTAIEYLKQALQDPDLNVKSFAERAHQRIKEEVETEAEEQ